MARKHRLLVDLEAVAWRPFNEVFPDDVEHHGKWIKVLSQDDETGALTALIRFEKGWSDNRDVYHKCVEEVFIVRGRFRIGDRIMSEGGYAYRPPLTLHGAAEALEETVMYISFDGEGMPYTDSGYETVE